jgi:signal transduction histidine kinase
MKLRIWHWLGEFRKLWETPTPEPSFHATRILKIQRTIVLPAKLLMLMVVVYYLFLSQWRLEDPEMQSRATVLRVLQQITVGYIVFTLGIALLLLAVRRFPLRGVQWLVLATGLADGVFLAAMLVITGGFQSTLFWAFPGLIVINALSIPLGAPQIMLNLSLSAFYMGAGILHYDIVSGDAAEPGMNMVQQLEAGPPRDRLPAQHDSKLTPAERRALMTAAAGHTVDLSPDAFILRLFVLWLLTVCCYGVQALAARQKQVEEEAREFAARQSQLSTAGRMAAEIAHQIKNPLAIINNATFSLKRAIANGKTDVSQQLQIIQEEVERSDRIVTQLMGYARLAEGRVEKLIVAEELERALAEVFPPAVGYEVEIERHFAPDLPPLFMQRGHFTAVVVNLLQNAREALNGKGLLRVEARNATDRTVEIVIQDNGPGISAEQTERIFEAYFTTKEKGTGLGLSIVKHNVDLYGGTIRVESGLGKGCRFVLVFPARTLDFSAKVV